MENLRFCLLASSSSPLRPLLVSKPLSTLTPLLINRAWDIQVESWKSCFLGLSSERARVPWEIYLKDWEAIKFSDEETWTWLLLRIIFEVIYFTWFIGRVLAVRGT